MQGTKGIPKKTEDRRARLRKSSALRTGTKSRVRQELGPETDINNILKRFGLNAPQRQGVYGQTIDYNMDLATARSTVSEALDAYMTLPDKLRARYRTLDEFRKGVESGAIKPADLSDEVQEPQPPAPEPPKPPKEEVKQ